jgi:hypothetical protein
VGYSRKRVDRNQPEIVKAVRKAGATVGHTHEIGKGFPDIVIGCEGLSLVGNFSRSKVREALVEIKGVKIIEGCNLLVEIKDDQQPESKRKLTPDEADWHDKWRGQLEIVAGVRAAIRLISGDEAHYKMLCAKAGIEPEPVVEGA